jgi:hypothetical protein
MDGEGQGKPGERGLAGGTACALHAYLQCAHHLPASPCLSFPGAGSPHRATHTIIALQPVSHTLPELTPTLPPSCCMPPLLLPTPPPNTNTGPPTPSLPRTW